MKDFVFLCKTHHLTFILLAQFSYCVKLISLFIMHFMFSHNNLYIAWKISWFIRRVYSIHKLEEWGFKLIFINTWFIVLCDVQRWSYLFFYSFLNPSSFSRNITVYFGENFVLVKLFRKLLSLSSLKFFTLFFIRFELTLKKFFDANFI